MNTFAIFLQHELERRKRRNSKYSLRSFARDAHIDASSLSQLLRGKRKLSMQRARAILVALKIAESKRNQILKGVLDESSLGHIKPVDYTVWPGIGDELMSTWLCYAILSTFELQNFPSTVDWISKKLAAPREKVSYTLDLLEEAGLINRQVKPWTFAQVSLTTQPGYMIDAVRHVHSEYIDLANKHLKSTASSKKTFAERTSDYSGITAAINREQLAEIFARVKEFRRSLAAYLAEGKAHDAVYRFNFQVFPLTKE